jgi:hypothetical protein
MINKIRFYYKKLILKKYKNWKDLNNKNKMNKKEEDKIFWYKLKMLKFQIVALINNNLKKVRLLLRRMLDKLKLLQFIKRSILIEIYKIKINLDINCFIINWIREKKLLNK